MPTIIGTRKKTTFSLYLDNHLSSVKTFQDMHKFLCEIFFPRIAFNFVYLIKKKTLAFDDRFNILSFEKIVKGLKPALKYQDMFKNWATPTNRKELDTFF